MTPAAVLAGSTSRDFAAAGLTVSGDILPAVPGGSSLGSPTQKFRSVYTQDLYVDASTLYVDGVAVLHSSNNAVNVSADTNQGVNVATTGSVVVSTISGNAGTATKLAAAQTIALSGDAAGSATFDGSAAATISVALASSGVTAGTYNSTATAHVPFTVDAKGRVTAVGTPVTIAPAWSSITGAPTIPTTAAQVGAVAATAVGAASGVASLDSTGKVPAAQLPVTTFPITVVTGTTTLAAANNLYVIVGTATHTLTLPAGPASGDTVQYANQSGLITNVIARNGQNINRLAEDLTINSDYASLTLRYIDSTRGWINIGV